MSEDACMAAVAEIERAAPFLDASWSGRGIKPSEKATIILCMRSTAYYGVAMPWGRAPRAPTPQAAAALADEFAAWVLHEARQRYRAGFYADPFTDHPISRPKEDTHV